MEYIQSSSTTLSFASFVCAESKRAGGHDLAPTSAWMVGQRWISFGKGMNQC